MIVILHNIRSLYNVGSIFRTADAVGIEKIYLCGYTPSPKDRFGKYIPQLSKVALGAEKNVPWDASVHSAQSIKKLIEKFKDDRYKVFAVEQSRKSIPYYTLNPKRYTLNKIALILGNEINGLPPSILKLADKILEIPIAGAVVRQAHHPRHTGRGKESLNVSVAFGIVAFGLKYS